MHSKNLDRISYMHMNLGNVSCVRGGLKTHARSFISCTAAPAAGTIEAVSALPLFLRVPFTGKSQPAGDVSQICPAVSASSPFNTVHSSRRSRDCISVKRNFNEDLSRISTEGLLM